MCTSWLAEYLYIILCTWVDMNKTFARQNKRFRTSDPDPDLYTRYTEVGTVLDLATPAGIYVTTSAKVNYTRNPSIHSFIRGSEQQVVFFHGIITVMASTSH